MRRPAVLAAAAHIAAVVGLVLTLNGCSTGQRVDLGDGSSGNLIAAIAGEPDQLDPHKTSAYFSFEVLENVFDTLVEPDANLEMRPALAESWDVSPDQLTWTFHLRPGVTFHDGSPFTADDVVYSYRRIIDEKLTNSDKFSAVTDVSAPDHGTVVIRVKQPTPNLLTNIGGFKGMAIVQRKNVESGQIATHPVGTGPFAFVGQKSGDSITLTANPNVLGWPPEGPRRDVPVHLRAVHRTVGAAGRRSRLDRLDSARNGSRSSESDDSIRLAVTPSNDYWYLALNEAANRGTTSGCARRSPTASTATPSCRPPATAPRPPTSSRYPQGNPWFTPLRPLSSYDIDKAKALLREAGIDQSRTSTCWSPASIPETVTAAQIIADNLAPLGITVNIRTVDFATWLDEQNNGHFDMLMMGWLGNIDPDDFYYAQHHTDGTQQRAEVLQPRGRPPARRRPGRNRPSSPSRTITPRRRRSSPTRSATSTCTTRRSSRPGRTDADRLSRPGATGPSGSAPRQLRRRGSHSDPLGDPSDLRFLARRLLYSLVVLLGRAHRRVRAGASGARRPGAHRAGHPLHPGGLRRAAVGQRTGPPADRPVLQLRRAPH